MPGSYTGVPTNVPETGAAAPTTAAMMVGTDAPTAASASNPLKTVYDYLADLIVTRGLLTNVARTVTAVLTYAAQQLWTPANDYTAPILYNAGSPSNHQLMMEWSQGTGYPYIRLYSAAYAAGFELTCNAKWDAAGAGSAWYPDQTSIGASRILFLPNYNANIGSLNFQWLAPTLPASWTNVQWATNPVTPVTATPIVLATNIAASLLSARMTADGYVHLSGLAFTNNTAAAISSGQTLATLPVGYRPVLTAHYSAAVSVAVSAAYGYIGVAGSTGVIAYFTNAVTWPLGTGMTFGDISFSVND